MASGTVRWFGNVPQAFFNKEIDLLSDDIRVSLHTSSFTPNQDTHDYYDDVTNEVSGTGYTAGGAQINNDTLTYTSGTNVMKYDGDDVSWTTSTIAGARIAVIRDATPATDATRPLIGYCTFDADVSTSAGTLTITWDSNGILTLTAAA